MGYLSEVACEWDKDGPTMPHEFVNMLKFETKGTPQKDAVNEVLAELSVEATS